MAHKHNSYAQQAGMIVATFILLTGALGVATALPSGPVPKFYDTCDSDFMLRPNGVIRCFGDDNTRAKTGCPGAVYIRPDHTFWCETADGNDADSNPKVKRDVASQEAAIPKKKTFDGICAADAMWRPNGVIRCIGSPALTEETGCPGGFFVNPDRTYWCDEPKYYGVCVGDFMLRPDGSQRCGGNADTARLTGCPGAFYLYPDHTFRCDTQGEN